jgi:hypothetical protein
MVQTLQARVQLLQRSLGAGIGARMSSVMWLLAGRSTG